ncbi:MAG: MtrB/PioB family decaheme-associated outer membrane protein [Woeseiaceae bacterium]|nr:MtrB/PioB family decaheme-associated outer membrane protein [Woeseiaceae bacterium]
MRTTVKSLALPILLLGPAVVVADVDTSEWLCESCPFETGYRAEYEAGVSNVSEDAARFGNGNGYDEEGTYANFDGSGHYTTDDYQLDWMIEDLGLASRFAEISGGKQGNYGFYLAYRELPYRLFDTTQTIFTGSLGVPAGWVGAGSTSGMTALDSSLRTRGIESDRRILDAGGHWLSGEQWRVFADFRRQNNEGIDIIAGSGFSQAAQLPRVHDYETDQIDLGIQYRLPRGSATLAYYGSFFSNSNDSLSWQSPFATIMNPERNVMAEAPDNEFQQLTLSGHYRFDTWRSVVAASLATGKGEQDDGLLPYTSLSGIPSDPLPRSSLDGSVDTTNFAVTWTARPMDGLRVKAAYRYDDRDNTTPQTEWTRVIVDLVNSGEPEQNIPYSFERSKLNLSAEYRLFSDWRLSAGYDYKTLDRDFQEVAEQTEDTGWGQVRWKPRGWADLRLRGGASRRDIDRYDLSVTASAGQNPLLRKYNLAYRYREFLEFVASASLPNAPLSVGATFYRSDDDYSRSLLGMTDARETRLTTDLTWTISETASAYLVYGDEQIEASQLGSAGFGDADWSAAHDDNFDHLGIGLALRNVAEKLDLSFDYTRGNGDSAIGVTTDTNGFRPLPDLESKLDSLRIEAEYRHSEQLEITATLRYEQFSADDWALQEVEPATISTLLTLGADPYDYDLWVFGVGFRYRFGDRDIALAE